MSRYRNFATSLSPTTQAIIRRRRRHVSDGQFVDDCRYRRIESNTGMRNPLSVRHQGLHRAYHHVEKTRHRGRLLLIIMPRRDSSVCLSVPPDHLGAQRLGQLQPSRPPELCGRRIRPRTDVDPPRSAEHIVSPRDNLFVYSFKRLYILRIIVIHFTYYCDNRY